MLSCALVQLVCHMYYLRCSPLQDSPALHTLVLGGSGIGQVLEEDGVTALIAGITSHTGLRALLCTAYASATRVDKSSSLARMLQCGMCDLMSAK